MRSSVISAISSIESHASDALRGPEVSVPDRPARRGDISAGSQAVTYQGHHHRTARAASLLKQAGVMTRDVVGGSHRRVALWTNTSIQAGVVR